MYLRYSAPSVSQEMERLQREMNALFSAFPSRLRRPSSYPALNVWTSPDSAVITAEVPGVNPEDIHIAVVGDTLTLTGERKADDADQSAHYHRRERGFGKFSRSLELPFRVDANKVEATFAKGVLHITLPRAEADKPKKIVVKTG